MGSWTRLLSLRALDIGTALRDVVASLQAALKE
jgi:hypothetical protein